MKYLILFTSLLFGYVILFVCIINWWNPYYTDFGNGYYISSDKDYGVTDLVYEFAENDQQNRNLCLYDSLGHKDTMIVSPNNNREVILGEHIAEIVADDDYILLQRKPKNMFDSLYRSALKNDSLAFYGFNYDYDYSFRHLFKTIEYWIIDKQSDDAYGPLSLNRFDILREQLGVSEKLCWTSEDQSFEIKSVFYKIKIIFILILPLLFSILIAFCIKKHKGKLNTL